MSRVEEARRRAAEAAADESNSVNEGAEVLTADVDVEALAREPFPVEMPGPRPVSATAVAKPGPTVTTFLRVPNEATKPASVASKPRHPIPLIQRIDGGLAAKVVIDRDILPMSREEYRRLAAALHRQAADGVKVVMIASASPSEGKTLTATNLALTLSESYQRNVLLIDADLRRPALHNVFHLDNSSGLGDGLTAAGEARLPVRQVSSRLAILPAGKASSDPMAGLTSARMRQVIDEARDAFDWIIIDTPPVGLLTDANLLGSMVDGVVLVVKAGSTAYDLVDRAVHALGRDRVIGVVLNRAESGHQVEGYSYYRGYYGPVANSDA